MCSGQLHRSESWIKWCNKKEFKLKTNLAQKIWYEAHYTLLLFAYYKGGLIYAKERGGMKNCVFCTAVCFFRYPSDLRFLNAIGVCYPWMRLEFICCSGNKLHKLWKLEAVWHVRIKVFLQADLKECPQANPCCSCSSPASWCSSWRLEG